MARYDLDVRAARLGIKHSQIIRELNARGIGVSPSEYYQFKNGANPPKSDLVMAEADKIVSEQEEKRNAPREGGLS